MDGNTDYPDVTRFEVIDHRKCFTCGGNGDIFHDDVHLICPDCDGSMMRGRILVKYDVKVMASLQDDGRTLKVFLTDN